MICEGAEILPFIYPTRGEREVSLKVRLFDEYGGEARNIPTRSWDDLDEIDTGEGPEYGLVAPGFMPSQKGNRDALDLSILQPEVPESPDDESESESEKTLIFGKVEV